MKITCECGEETEGFDGFREHVRKEHPGERFELRVAEKPTGKNP